MSFEAAGVTYRNAQECVREMKRIIRVGEPLSGTSAEQKAKLTQTFLALNKHAAKSGLDDLTRLRVITLEAELYQQYGDHQQSAKVLKSEWEKLESKLMTWSKANPLEPTKDQRLLRQKLWLLMHYVFYYHYRVTRKHDTALDLLLRIEIIVRNELKSPRYHPAGTLAILNYFIGLCYRVSRGFVRAERALLQAQQETYNRAKRELSKDSATDDSKKETLAYKDVLSARVLYGLGWVALQQGQLLRAEQYLSAARNALLDTRQEYLQLLIQSLLWVVIRRKTPYGSSEYLASLEGLITQHDLSQGLHELMRQRCAFELIRGYLDLAEFGAKGEQERLEYLENAKEWMSKLNPQAGPSTGQRIALYRARFFLITENLRMAEKEITIARTLAEETSLQQRGVLILEAVLWLKRKSYEKALETLKLALAGIVSVTQSRPEQGKRPRPLDPVLEAECCILLAHTYAARNDKDRAKHYRDRWEMLSKVVENYYLEQLAQRIVIQDSPFELEYEFPIHAQEKDGIPTIQDRIIEFECYMIKTVRERHPELKLAQIAYAHGLSRVQFGRHCRALGISRGQ